MHSTDARKRQAMTADTAEELARYLDVWTKVLRAFRGWRWRRG